MVLNREISRISDHHMKELLTVKYALNLKLKDSKSMRCCGIKRGCAALNKRHWLKVNEGTVLVSIG